MGIGSTVPKKKRYGPYLIYEDARIIDIRTGKTLKKHKRKGKYVIGLRMKNEPRCKYHQLHRLLYKVFINSDITRYDYVIPIDGNYLNLSMNNWKLCSAKLYHKKFPTVGRARVIDKVKEEKIFRLHKKGLSLRKIASECLVSSCTVQRVVSGNYYKGSDKL